MQTRWSRSRISLFFCGVCPTTATLPKVWPRPLVVERLPPQDARRLILQGLVCPVVGVNEEVGSRFVVVLAATKKGAMHLGNVPRRIDSVGLSAHPRPCASGRGRSALRGRPGA